MQPFEHYSWVLLCIALTREVQVDCMLRNLQGETHINFLETSGRVISPQEASNHFQKAREEHSQPITLPLSSFISDQPMKTTTSIPDAGVPLNSKRKYDYRLFSPLEQQGREKLAKVKQEPGLDLQKEPARPSSLPVTEDMQHIWFEASPVLVNAEKVEVASLLPDRAGFKQHVSDMGGIMEQGKSSMQPRGRKGVHPFATDAPAQTTFRITETGALFQTERAVASGSLTDSITETSSQQAVCPILCRVAHGLTQGMLSKIETLSIPERRDMFGPTSVLAYTLMAKGVSSFQWRCFEEVFTSFLTSIGISESAPRGVERQARVRRKLIWISTVLSSAAHPEFLDELSLEFLRVDNSAKMYRRSIDVRRREGGYELILYLAMAHKYPRGYRSQWASALDSWFDAQFEKEDKMTHTGNAAQILSQTESEWKTWQERGKIVQTIASRLGSLSRKEHGYHTGALILAWNSLRDRTESGFARSLSPVERGLSQRNRWELISLIYQFELTKVPELETSPINIESHLLLAALTIYFRNIHFIIDPLWPERFEGFYKTLAIDSDRFRRAALATEVRLRSDEFGIPTKSLADPTNVIEE